MLRFIMSKITSVLYLIIIVTNIDAVNNVIIDPTGLAENATIKGQNYCMILNEKYKGNRKNLTVYAYSKPYDLTVLSTYRAPARATAALIAMALRHKLGYNVSTRIDNRTNCNLISSVIENPLEDTQFLIHVDADWQGPDEQCETLPSCTMNKKSCSITGSRLSLVGATPALQVNMYAVLGQAYFGKTACQSIYYILSHMDDCGFIEKSKNETDGCVFAYVLPEVPIPAKLQSIKTLETNEICYQTLRNRSELMHHMKSKKASFFFIDYDLYENDAQVKIIPFQRKEIIGNIGLRVADLLIFRQFAPMIDDILRLIAPQPRDLRQMLEINSVINDIDEAVCKWANDYQSKCEAWSKTSAEKLWILIMTCEGDPDFMELFETVENATMFDYVVNVVSSAINQNMTDLSFKMKTWAINCSDPNQLITDVLNLKNEGNWQWLAGVAALGSGAEAAAAKVSHTQLALYDVPPSKARLHNASITSTGNLHLLAQAFKHFIHKHGWKRVAIISDKSSLAEDFTFALDLDDGITFGNFILESVDNTSFENILNNLDKQEARIIILNTGKQITQSILCKFGMGLETKYTWIAREWSAYNGCKANIKAFLITYSWYAGNASLLKGFGGNEKMLTRIHTDMGNKTWPDYFVPLSDALLLLAHRLAAGIASCTNCRYDFHRQGMESIMTKEFKQQSIAGLLQPLELVEHSRKDPLIFLTSWKGDVSVLLEIWRANSTNKDIVVLKRLHETFVGNPPDDGSSRCLIRRGNDFHPHCGDIAFAVALSLVLLALILLWRARKYRMKHVEQTVKDRLLEHLVRSERIANILGPYLVERTSLELLNELGSGQFGRVRFGLLRQDNRKPVAVGAKALRKDAAPADEAEFLREASFLAQLSHPHIIRLVGVCVYDGPPLLLMKHAFFGDLRHYLKTRRHLAELINHVDNATPRVEETPICADQESFYVSPQELTRLAREAAEALAYLSDKHLLHRDIRAANCLVDEHRSLQLGDFGMARAIGAKTNEELEDPTGANSTTDYIYICQRKGIFPVPWMAPESLAKGEFSHASDVWALGVLILEVATLGARPYRAWHLTRVLKYVRDGGTPPLPIDASYHTCEVTEKCWSQIPSERATAREIACYLSHQACIRAALGPPWPDMEQDGSDSGLGDYCSGLQMHNLQVSTL